MNKPRVCEDCGGELFSMFEIHGQISNPDLTFCEIEISCHECGLLVGVVEFDGKVKWDRDD